MKLLSKKTGLGLIAVLLVAGALAFFACEKEVLFPQSNAAEYPDFDAMLPSDVYDLATIEPISMPLPFDFDFIVTKCGDKTAKPRVTLKVVIKEFNEPNKLVKPERYSYRWEVNREVVGTGPELACFCAKSAKLTVTRMADNQRVGKTIRLWVCSERKPQSANEEL